MQESLDQHLPWIGAIDTHSKQLRMDFKYPEGEPVAFLPNAKPDLTARHLPMYWEVGLRLCEMFE